MHAAPLHAPLQIHSEKIRAEWVDYNGHLRDAFYSLIFSFSTDALMDYIGLDVDARERHHTSLYTLESHVNYLQEVKEGAVVRVTTQLLEHDAKRLQILHVMYVGDDIEPVAVSEQMLMHVDTQKKIGVPFFADVMSHIEEIAASHRQLSTSKYVGRVMRIGHKN